MVSDDDDDEEDNDIDFGNFSTCSPRFTRLISIVDNKEYQNALKDLEERASKECSSADDLPDDASDITDITDEAGTENDASLESKEDGSNEVGLEVSVVVDDPEPDPVRTKLLPSLLPKSDEHTNTDSGNDSGTHTGGSSLDDSHNCAAGSLLKQVTVDVQRKCEDSDRDTE